MKIRKLLAWMLLGMLTMSAQAATLTDVTGRVLEFEDAPRNVAALLGSYGEVWLAAGGHLAGTTQDAANTPAALAQGGVVDLGSHSEPNMELLFSLEPDFVILSADTAAHPAIAEVLDGADVPYGYFSMLDYRGYMDMLGSFTALTGRQDLYDAQVEAVQKPIEGMIAEAKTHEDYGQKTALLLRAYSTSVKAKGSEDTVAGYILRDMGLKNVADADGGLLDNLTMEAIMVEDPDYIFVVTMGADTEAALRCMEETLLSNPAWSTLTAVKEGRYVLLEKELFHNRPNGRWAESYGIIRDLLYGQE